MRFGPREEILGFEEIERLVRILAGLGVDKVRLTGGEPLVRRDLPRLIERIAATAGSTRSPSRRTECCWPQQAQPLYDSGLRRLNVHLDTLDRAHSSRSRAAMSSIA